MTNNQHNYDEKINHLEKEVAKLKDRIKLLESLAKTDELTQLLNRRGFFDMLTREIERLHRGTNKNCAVIMCDIDHFKQINDTYGHNFGDVCLKTAANILNDGVRKTDIVARIGGDEFVILMDNITAHTIDRIISNINSFELVSPNDEGKKLVVKIEHRV